MYWILGIAGWVACGVVAYFLIRRHFVNKFSKYLGSGAWERTDAVINAMLAITGPLHLTVVLIFLATTPSSLDIKE